MFGGLVCLFFDHSDPSAPTTTGNRPQRPNAHVAQMCTKPFVAMGPDELVRITLLGLRRRPTSEMPCKPQEACQAMRKLHVSGRWVFADSWSRQASHKGL